MSSVQGVVASVHAWVFPKHFFGVHQSERVLHVQQANHLGFGQLGLIATLFMVAAMVASGVITVLVERFSPFRIMGLSMMVWSCGVALTGASQGFCWLLPARLLAGAGAKCVAMFVAELFWSNLPSYIPI